MPSCSIWDSCYLKHPEKRLDHQTIYSSLRTLHICVQCDIYMVFLAGGGSFSPHGSWCSPFPKNRQLRLIVCRCGRICLPFSNKQMHAGTDPRCQEYLPRTVRVRTMFFMILSQTMLHVLSGASALASRWLSSILTSTCFICCILLALELWKGWYQLLSVTLSKTAFSIPLEKKCLLSS